MTDEWIWTSPPPAVPLTGSERFKGLPARVKDLWAFCMSDLKVNYVRGYLAEFLVSEAGFRIFMRMVTPRLTVAPSADVIRGDTGMSDDNSAGSQYLERM